MICKTSFRKTDNTYKYVVFFQPSGQTLLKLVFLFEVHIFRVSHSQAVHIFLFLSVKKQNQIKFSVHCK